MCRPIAEHTPPLSGGPTWTALSSTPPTRLRRELLAVAQWHVAIAEDCAILVHSSFQGGRCLDPFAGCVIAQAFLATGLLKFL